MGSNPTILVRVLGISSKGEIINLDLIQRIYTSYALHEEYIVKADHFTLTKGLSYDQCKMFIGWLWRKMEEGLNFLTYDDYVRVYTLT